jgi:hypothetical protein
MLRKVRPALSYANVMATIAVFLALGGGAYAVTQLERNQVRARHIAPNAVARSEIKARGVGRAEVAPHAIDSTRVRNGALLAQDFAPGQLPRGPEGPPGPPNPNAETLDGIDSTGFVRGAGEADFERRELAADTSASGVLAIPDFGRFDIECFAGGAAAIRFFNTTTDPVPLWVQSGSSSPSFTTLDPGPPGLFHSVSGGASRTGYFLGRGSGANGRGVAVTALLYGVNGHPCRFQLHSLAASG